MSEFPTVSDSVGAKLPATYEAARAAIAECSRVDECKEWADKAAALASYARQAKDDSLRVMALRIQARAERRCGELLKQIPRGDGATRYGQAGSGPPVTRTSAAADAGLSDRQRKTALRIANVPPGQFDAAIEGSSPPTLTALAALGTEKRAPLPEELRIAREAQNLLRDFAGFCGAHDPVRIALAMSDPDSCRGNLQTIDTWLDRFVTNLQSENEAA